MSEPGYPPTCHLCGLVIRGSENSLTLPDVGQVHDLCRRASRLQPACVRCHEPIDPTRSHAMAPDGRAWHAACLDVDEPMLLGGPRAYCPGCSERLRPGRAFVWRDNAAWHHQCRWFRDRDEARWARREVRLEDLVPPPTDIIPDIVVIDDWVPVDGCDCMGCQTARRREREETF